MLNRFLFLFCQSWLEKVLPCPNETATLPLVAWLAHMSCSLVQLSRLSSSRSPMVRRSSLIATGTSFPVWLWQRLPSIYKRHSPTTCTPIPIHQCGICTRFRTRISKHSCVMLFYRTFLVRFLRSTISIPPALNINFNLVPAPTGT